MTRPSRLETRRSSCVCRSTFYQAIEILRHTFPYEDTEPSSLAHDGRQRYKILSPYFYLNIFLYPLVFDTLLNTVNQSNCHHISLYSTQP